MNRNRKPTPPPKPKPVTTIGAVLAVAGAIALCLLFWWGGGDVTNVYTLLGVHVNHYPTVGAVVIGALMFVAGTELEI